MAGWPAGPKAAHAGHGRSGQQDSTNRLGAHGARRLLQGSGSGGLIRQSLRRQRRQKVDRGMAQRSEDGVGKTSECPGASSARNRYGPDPRSPYRPVAVTMAAS